MATQIIVLGKYKFKLQDMQQNETRDSQGVIKAVVYSL